MGELRESKKRETRQRISNVATMLFYEHGFDAVTIDDVAREAKVSKMTVFNYFARKEDLLFDRNDEVKRLLSDALRKRPKNQLPIDALRKFVDELRARKNPFALVNSDTVAFLRVVSASASLKARLRELEDEVVEWLAGELGGANPDGLTRLSAGMIVLTWRTAYGEAVRVFEHGGSAKKANAVFMQLIDDGFAAVRTLER